MKYQTIKFSGDSTRLDKYLQQNISSFSRTEIQNNIKAGNVLVNELVSKSSCRLKHGDTIKIISHVNNSSSIDLLAPANVPLDIIFEDENVIVINKNSGISVHPAHSSNQPSVVNALINHYPAISNVVLEKDNPTSLLRPGVVHRLDKDTSGTMIFAKNIKTLEYLMQCFKKRDVVKQYRAICYNWPNEDSGKLINYLGRKRSDRKFYSETGISNGKKAVSDFKVVSYFKSNNRTLSLLNFRIFTGRTHQIRVQSLLMGNPVLGDKRYFTRESKMLSQSLSIKRQLLHSFRLSITLPGDKELTTYVSPLPDDMSTIVNSLEHK